MVKYTRPIVKYTLPMIKYILKRDLKKNFYISRCQKKAFTPPVTIKNFFKPAAKVFDHPPPTEKKEVTKKAMNEVDEIVLSDENCLPVETE